MAKILTLPSRSLRARVTLYGPIDIADGMGGHERSWHAISTRWAQVTQLNTQKTDARGVSNVRLQVVIRRPSPPFTLPMRLQWRGEHYRVVQLEDAPHHGYQQCICERVH
jgi:head-tail adaptor